MAEPAIGQEENFILSTFHGVWLNRCLSLVVGFKIPDLLCNTDKPSVSIEDIAAKTGCSSSEKIYLIMRLLAQWGIGKELENRHFAKNRAMELLRMDQGPSFGHFLSSYSSEEYLMGLLSLPEAVRSNQSAFFLAHGMKDFYEYMNQIDDSPYDKSKQFRGSSTVMIGSDERRREFADYFNKGQAMRVKLLLLPEVKGIPTVYNVYPWSTCKRLLDAGGSTGSFLASILKQPDCQDIQGFVADLPAVVDTALQEYHQLGLPENRIKFLKHNFFEPYPKDFHVDAIVFKNTLVIFSVQEKIQIIRNCRSVLHEGGKVLVLTLCVNDAGVLHKNVGINGIQHGVHAVLTSNFLNGVYKTRSESEKDFREIGNQAGFKLSNIYETFLGGITIFELSAI
ncbi:uncharacterized protein LOC116306099 [Actinia tenebrosa]|uniref:Acetylserotonin O-methyltransferase n=1 Tax=Actinia tenebrosa TaxID=6105 RepID=A0A6P8IXT4_ACTTE|nr:uncharacterized protein LOC116306099 [Actinia tenebrosa]XP_031571995.1 uncharacterized protein LOC116306099 [Actinia tenebrosa]